jgi:hypothetical protein
MKVAESLWAAEDAIDMAYARAAEFNGALASARCEAELSAIVGQDAFEGAAAALSAIAKARGELVETHRRLTEVKIQIGLRAMDIGDGGKPPAAALPSQLLRAVA